MNSSLISARTLHTDEINNPAQPGAGSTENRLARVAAHLGQQLTNGFQHIKKPLENLFSCFKPSIDRSEEEKQAPRPVDTQQPPKVWVQCSGEQLLSMLKKTPELTQLKLTGVITSAHIQSLKNAINLTSLDLSGATGIDNNCIAGIPAYCTRLKHIDLNGCNKITDNGLFGFALLKKIETFNLNNCPHVTTLMFMQEWTNLTSLQLKGCTGIQAGEQEYLHQATELKALLLPNNNSNISEAEWISLSSRLPQLKNIQWG